ncbi:hypothetical protein niasHT_038388 [Heterodera trifolii]|uniref:Uncharacterized protein n=1 Tax=Heterodera trifolii TaxID=157864 RepID=A0ABD2J0P9_9BILA
MPFLPHPPPNLANCQRKTMSQSEMDFGCVCAVCRGTSPPSHIIPPSDLPPVRSGAEIGYSAAPEGTFYALCACLGGINCGSSPQYAKMKNFFFKKAALPNSASFDSTLNGPTMPNTYQQDNISNSIDKPPQRGTKIVQQRPNTLASIGGTFIGTSQQQCYQRQTPQSFDQSHQLPPHQLTSPISCSSTQGTIGGCAVGNELFKQNHTSGWHFMPVDSTQSPASAQCPSRHIMPHNCRQSLLMAPPHQLSAGGGPSAAGCSSQQQQPQQQQVPDLMMYTIVQQLSTKDAEIERLRMALRRGRETVERERERHADEENAAREQISPTTTNNSEAMAVAKLENLTVDHGKLNMELAQQKRAVAEREAAWDRERAELNQTVRSLNNTLEELEQELRQREVHGREMQLQFERTVVERDMAQMELLDNAKQSNNNQQHHQQEHINAAVHRSSMLHLASPNSANSGTAEEHNSSTTAAHVNGGGPSLASSSGIDSNTTSCSVTADAKEIDTKHLRLARRKLIECRQKVARLLRSAEKAMRGERLGRDDLFGSYLDVHDDLQQVLPNNATQMQLIDDKIMQIGALRKEMELLHDKFIILYARGTFQK